MSSGIERFAQLGISDPLLLGLEDAGYEQPSPLQVACISPLRAGRDLIGQVQPGAGKTLAFVLPLLEKIDPTEHRPQAMVLTPTHDIAVHVAEVCQRCARHLPDFHVLPIHGGEGLIVQQRQMKRGVHAVIGTPCWVIDHVEGKRLSLDGLRMLVLDDADDMLRMGFGQDIDWIFAHVPPQCQTVVFYAFLQEQARRLLQRHLHAPLRLPLLPPTPAAAIPGMRQRYWKVGRAHKLGALARLIEVEAELDAALVFVHTRTAAAELAELLAARGYGVVAIDGEMPVAWRDAAVARLKNREIDIVVTTDLAARGIDVARISHVIHYDMPCDTDSYLERISHVGPRGTAILLVAPYEIPMFIGLEHSIGQPIPELALPERPRGR
ncbi:MAG: DEAD/DEAH box helicase [Sulfurisoma sp.]|nr:DEAD/DEAH box helicase [Sulfurisoma sp.]